MTCSVRRALIDAPENVATLIHVVSSRLFNSISDHTFPSTPNTSVAAYASSFIKSATVSQEKSATKEVLNCLRILQRILPIVFEIEGESNAFEQEVLWKREESKEEGKDRGAPQFVIDDDDESERDVETPRPSASQHKAQLQPSLGERLLTAVTDLMFCCGFTLPTSIQVDHHKINYVIW